MIRELLKVFAYSRAPRAAFALSHPVKTARLAKMRFDLKHAYAPRVTALGVAALALPLGFLLGRVNGRRA
jgi:hypothetical protein